MRNFISRPLAPTLFALALGFTAAPAPLNAAAADDLRALREQLQALEQKIRSLERKQELKDEETAAAAKAAPKITASDGRVEISSSDGANSLRLRGLVQGDYRYYDAANDPADTFLLRRARLIFEGKFANLFSYVVQSEFAGTVQILDANVNAAFSPAFNLRVGKFKTPVGLEQLQSDPVAVATSKWFTISTENWTTFAASNEVTRPFPETSPAICWFAESGASPTTCRAISVASKELMASL